MDNLNIEEVKQLVNFYKQKSADFEFALLQNQIITNRVSQDLNKANAELIDLKNKMSSTSESNNKENIVKNKK